MRDSQVDHNGRFREILPFHSVCGSHLDCRQREYGQSDDWGKAVGDKTSTAFSFSRTRPRHSHSVIVRELENRILGLKPGVPVNTSSVQAPEFCEKLESESVGALFSLWGVSLFSFSGCLTFPFNTLGVSTNGG